MNKRVRRRRFNIFLTVCGNLYMITEYYTENFHPNFLIELHTYIEIININKLFVYPFDKCPVTIQTYLKKNIPLLFLTISRLSFENVDVSGSTFKLRVSEF